MKLIILFASIMIFININILSAQSTITVQSGSSASFYTSIDSALANAQNGDYIYLPGGAFNIGTLLIDKGVHIIGAGHYPDSTTATLVTTFFGGNIRIVNGASNGSIEGIKLFGNIDFGNGVGTDSVNNFLIRRISCVNVRLGAIAGGSNATNINIKDCIVDYIIGYDAQNVLVSNCIIQIQVQYFNSNATFSNNVFLNRGTPCGGNWFNYGIGWTTGVLFENNIFNSICIFYNGGPNILNNNLFVDSPSLSTHVTNANVFNVPLSNVFVNQSGILFDYSHDYHLKNGSPAIGKGTGGTDIGIYGGILPYKEGAVPHNPHIQYKSIAGTTDQNGNLQLNIKVRAQDE